MHILHVVGARPNFMKAAPVLCGVHGRNGTRQTLVHTGQHYDNNMSDVFFEQLQLPRPDLNLAVGSGSQARQTAEIMVRFEAVVLERKPDLVVVYGDVNSTVAAALVCSKLMIPVAHVEAGLRSFDRAMPEEINRLLTDQISDLLFTPSQDGDENLVREGIVKQKIHLVGNVMIDTLIRLLEKAEHCAPPHVPERYVLVTLHRPSNVDDLEALQLILEALAEIGRDVAVVFPVHPRTRQRLGQLGIDLRIFHLLEPLPYLEFLALQRRASAVITDSGGIQEETTYLGIPCITLRENTERPITVALGTNVVVGRDMTRLRDHLNRAVSGQWKRGRVPPLWDGHAGRRIANILS
ncbi:MAG TPA: UDP-N-acetylglucosamine 2-epimerase (non-hydrolyzing) [Terriglobales bacterium]|nr:UDP-N-acetylglucosamine 2-epimerase (non-hydrolyzing) [Terriglobales bacterium]